jgi:DNA helicase-2/ATP-dependent DNA helicase PcrA
MFDFEAAFERLNEDQRHAVQCPTSAVVLAGPGSGKTDTIVLKVAHLLSKEIPETQGLACMTFGNDAVREFSQRLREMGFRPGHRLFLGTVHSFALNQVIRPFASILRLEPLINPRLVSSTSKSDALNRVRNDFGFSLTDTALDNSITQVRRAVALQTSLDSFDERMVFAATEYEALLNEMMVVDFESLTLGALAIIEQSESVRAILVAKFPWIAVDEYQDLGGPLNRIVLRLEESGCKIFAVGDPDQSIYGFGGADPRFLRDLTERDSFATFRLKFNYRSGQQIIDAAEVSLGQSRGYLAPPGREDQGHIDILPVDGGLEGQSRFIVETLVPRLLLEGVPAHEIAVLFRSRDVGLETLYGASLASSISYLFETDKRVPSSPFFRWLQRCAAWSLDDIDSDSLLDLCEDLQNLVSHPLTGFDEVEQMKQMMMILEHSDRATPFRDWFSNMNDQLGLLEAMRFEGTLTDDIDEIERLSSEEDQLLLGELAGIIKVEGNVIVSTYHSSKGREFDVVILPELQKSLFPWDNRTVAEEQEDRRLFYVGITRARKRVFLIFSPYFVNNRGRTVHGPSKFVLEVQELVSQS